MIPSIETDKAFGKSIPFHDKKNEFNKLRIEGNYLNIRKIIYEKTTANIIFNG